MTNTYSVLLTGASGVGKSTIISGALETFGSGAIALAPGTDEMDSYLKFLSNPNFKFEGFDDTLYQPSIGDKIATGHTDMVKWLKAIYLEVRADVDAGKPPRYAVLGVDTLSAVGRLAYNATLSKFGYSEPPAAIGSSGAPFYSFLRNVLESGVRLMRAIRGCGVHWVVASHPTEAEVTAIQSGDGVKNKIMPDLPGGFKNVLPSFFPVVLDIAIDDKGKHFARWSGDPRRVTKSRFGPLAAGPKIDLPNGAKESWLAIQTAIDNAVAKLTGGTV